MIRYIRSIQRKRRLRQIRHEQSTLAHKRSSGKRINPLNRDTQKKTPMVPPVIHQWIRKDGWALAGIILLVLICLWYFGFQSERFVITEVSVTQTEFLSQDQIKSVTEQYVNTPILKFIPRNRYWTLSKNQLQDYLITQVGSSYAFKELRVTKQYPNILRVDIIERVPSVGWITIGSDVKGYYAIDRGGIVTQILDSDQQFHPAFPRIEDPNRGAFELQWQVASEEYIDFLLRVHEQFTQKTGLKADSYRFPPVRCRERQYVAEQIFQQEILESASDEFKDRKREIQKQFQDGVMDIDQSLEALEQIKDEELVKLGELNEGEKSFEKTEWKTVYIEADCDFVKIATDLVVHATQEDLSFDVYLEMNVDLDVQFKNIQRIMSEHIKDVSALSAIEYIDVRIPDRAYIK